MRGSAVLAFLVVAAATMLLAASAGGARVPAVYANCTALHALYPHGIGLMYAKDKTTGIPVATFRRSNNLYSLAISSNPTLDTDHDAIACEQ